MKKGKTAVPRDLTTQSPVRMSADLREKIHEYQRTVKREQDIDISFSEAIRSLVEKGLAS